MLGRNENSARIKFAPNPEVPADARFGFTAQTGAVGGRLATIDALSGCMVSSPDGVCFRPANLRVPRSHFHPGLSDEVCRMSATDPMASGEEPRTAEELRAAARAQFAEMEKYQWCLGVQLGRDPLLERSKDEIRAEWIAKHAADFRAWWEAARRGR